MLVAEFIREHGLPALVERTKVKASRHKEFPNLVMLKYDQIESPMGDPLTQRCRGLILDEAADWRVVSYPYNKFFNNGEGHAADLDWDSARVYEKLDGSIMTLYYYDGGWQVASNGSPDASGPVNDNKEKTFAHLFWETFGRNGYELPPEYLNDCCFMFELMTPENRIVVPHEKPRLVLHGARWLDEKTGYPELDPAIVAKECGWECVRTFAFDDFEAVLGYAETASGMEIEGFVVCDKNYNRQKVKTKAYVALHHLRSSFCNRRLVELIQANEDAEFLSYFPEYKDRFAEIRGKYSELCSAASSLYYKHANILVQKDFALAVKDSPFSAACFAVRAKKVPNVSAWFAGCDPKKLLKLMNENDQEPIPV